MATDDEKSQNKIQGVIERRGLEGLEVELKNRWEGKGFDEHSTRELSELFNRTVLQNALSTAGEVPLDGEVSNMYRLLTDDEVHSGSKMQARDRLSQYGVNPEDVTDDFVSHQTIYRFLKKNLGINTTPTTKSTAELVKNTRQSILRLNSRTQSVVAQNIEQLNQREEFTVGDFDVYVSIQFSCSDCGTTRELRKLLDQGGCACQNTDTEATNDN